MNQQPERLGFREYISIIILMVGLKATEETPFMLYRHVQNASWMIPILSGILFFIPLYLLIKTLSIFKDKNLFSVIQKLLGKYIGFFVCLLIFLINSFAISADSRTYSNIIRSFYFTTTPNLIIYGILMFVCAYGAKKGILHVGSVSYLVVFIILFAFYFALLLGIKDSQLASIFPIWGPGPLDILKEGTKRLTLFADFFILTILIPYFTSFNDFRKSTWVSLVIVILNLSIATSVYICLFDISMQNIGYPFHNMIRYVSIGQFLENVDILFFPLWLMAAFIRFSAFIYINSLMFGHLFKIKDFEYLIPSLTTIYFLIGMIPETPLDVLKGFSSINQYLAGPIFAFISFLLWMVALFKGEFKHAKNKNSM